MHLFGRKRRRKKLEAMFLFLPRTHCEVVKLTKILCVCVSMWLSGWLWERGKEFSQVCCSKRVMGLPEWNRSHGHTHCVTVDVLTLPLFPNNTMLLGAVGYWNQLENHAMQVCFDIS